MCRDPGVATHEPTCGSIVVERSVGLGQWFGAWRVGGMVSNQENVCRRQSPSEERSDDVRRNERPPMAGE